MGIINAGQAKAIAAAPTHMLMIGCLLCGMKRHLKHILALEELATRWQVTRNKKQQENKMGRHYLCFIAHTK